MYVTSVPHTCHNLEALQPAKSKIPYLYLLNLIYSQTFLQSHY